jgi:4-methylaminobutanoate oxidase (formaldehyde-forming)
MRLAQDAFQITTGTAQPRRDLHLLKRGIAQGEFVTITDITSAFGVISIAGPRSRELMQRLSPDAFDNASFPYLSHREVEVGGTVARVARLSYTGELGWELYVPTEAALPLMRAVLSEGALLDIRNAGAFALEGLRIEKGFCAWGHDIGPDETPLEAGLGFTTKLNTNMPFTGRKALEAQKSSGLRRRRVNLLLEDPNVLLLGTEPIVVDGAYCGQVMSAAYGHTLGGSVGIGFVRKTGKDLADALEHAVWEVEVALTRHRARASLAAHYDPGGVRARDSVS